MTAINFIKNTIFQITNYCRTQFHEQLLYSKLLELTFIHPIDTGSNREHKTYGSHYKASLHYETLLKVTKNNNSICLFLTYTTPTTILPQTSPFFLILKPKY